MENRINMVNEYFSLVDYTDNHVVSIDRCTTITNLQLFISSHLAIINNYKGNDVCLPYLERLEKFMNYAIQQ